MCNLLISLILILNRKENIMMAMFWAQQIILGKKKYGDVPRLLKDQVK